MTVEEAHSVDKTFRTDESGSCWRIIDRLSIPKPHHVQVSYTKQELEIGEEDLSFYQGLCVSFISCLTLDDGHDKETTKNNIAQ